MFIQKSDKATHQHFTWIVVSGQTNSSGVRSGWNKEQRRSKQLTIFLPCAIRVWFCLHRRSEVLRCIGLLEAFVGDRRSKRSDFELGLLVVIHWYCRRVFCEVPVICLNTLLVETDFKILEIFPRYSRSTWGLAAWGSTSLCLIQKFRNESSLV